MLSFLFLVLVLVASLSASSRHELDFDDVTQHLRAMRAASKDNNDSTFVHELVATVHLLIDKSTQAEHWTETNKINSLWKIAKEMAMKKQRKDPEWSSKLAIHAEDMIVVEKTLLGGNFHSAAESMINGIHEYREIESLRFNVKIEKCIHSISTMKLSQGSMDYYNAFSGCMQILIKRNTVIKTMRDIGYGHAEDGQYALNMYYNELQTAIRANHSIKDFESLPRGVYTTALKLSYYKDLRLETIIKRIRYDSLHFGKPLFVDADEKKSITLEEAKARIEVIHGMVDEGKTTQVYHAIINLCNELRSIKVITLELLDTLMEIGLLIRLMDSKFGAHVWDNPMKYNMLANPKYIEFIRQKDYDKFLKPY